MTDDDESPLCTCLLALDGCRCEDYEDVAFNKKSKLQSANFPKQIKSNENGNRNDSVPANS